MSYLQRRISVVIPAFNASGTLGRALQSVVSQSQPANEIIVVDDGSTDDLTPLQHEFSPHVQWSRQSNQGAAAARNRGIELSRGELIAFLDADDYWEPDKLEQQSALYKRFPELGLTCGDYFESAPGQPRYRVSPGDNSIPRRDRCVMLEGAEAFDAACCVWTGTVMAPRALLVKHPFQSGLEPAEDRDLWFRLLRIAPSYYLTGPLATAVLEPGSLSRTQIDRDCQNMLRVVDRAAPLIGPQAARRWKARTYRRWAAEYLGRGSGQRALRPACHRLAIEPWSAQAWWITAKSSAVALRIQLRDLRDRTRLVLGRYRTERSGGVP